MFNWVLRRASNATESIPGGWTANGRDLSWKGTTHSEPPPSPATTKAPPSPDANASPPGDVNPTENVAEDLRSQLAIAQQTKSELAFQVSQLERKVEWLQKSEAEHEKANRELVSELNRLAAEHANSNDQIDVLERELAKSLAVYINEQALHNDTKGKIVQLENAIEVLRGSLTTQSAEGKEAEEVLKEVIKGKDEEILKLAGQLDSRAHELASLKEVLFQAQRDRDGHVSARKLMETQYKAALAELEVANREAAEARKQLAAVRGTGNRDRSMSNVSLRQEGPLSNETAECALELRSALSELQVLLAGIEAERDEYKAMFQRLQAEAVACANEIRGSVKQLNNLPPSTCSLVQERGIVESQVDTHAIEELKAQLKEVIRDRDDARRSLAASQSTTAVNSPASSPRRSIGSEASDTSVNSDDHLNYTVAELKALLKDREQLLAQTTLDFHLLQSYHNQSAAKLSNYTVEELTALLQDRERLLTQTTLDFHLLQSYQSQGAGAGSKYSMEELAALLQDRERLLTQTTLDFHLLQSYQSQGAGATSKYSMEELAALLQDRERLLTQTTLDFHLLQSYQSQGAGAASKYSVEELAALLKDRESLLNQTTLDFHLLQSYQPQPAEKAPKRRSSMKTQDPLRRKSVTFSQENPPPPVRRPSTTTLLGASFRAEPATMEEAEELGRAIAIPEDAEPIARSPYEGPKVFDQFHPIPREEREEFAALMERADKVGLGALIKKETPIDENDLQVLKGDLTAKVDEPKRVVRVFIGSAAEDAEWERNALLLDVYPFLKQFCQRLGYEFQPVDLKFGRRDLTSLDDDHLMHNLAVAELRKCLEVSAGPAFMCLLGNKFGPHTIPSAIEKTEFNRIFQRLGTSNAADRWTDLQLLQEWFVLDQNVRPQSYVLQPISTVLPGFSSGESKATRLAVEKWWEVYGRIRRLLVEGSAVLNVEDRQKYMKGWIEEEIEAAFETDSVESQRALVFTRDFEGLLEDAPEHPEAAREYIDMIGRKTDVLATERLAHLRERLAPAFASTISWIDGAGFNPIEEAKHADHIRAFCDEFCRAVANNALLHHEARTVEERSHLVQEVAAHNDIAAKKMDGFMGHEELLEHLKHIVEGSVGDVSHPYIIHGVSGSGKSSLAASSIRLAQEQNPAVNTVYRAIGSTADSTDIRPLLRSLISQISTIYGAPSADELSTTDFDQLIDAFHASLALAKEESPLLVVLDGPEHLSDLNDGRDLAWFPQSIPAHVRLVVATRDTTGEGVGCFDLFRSVVPSEEQYLAVPRLSDEAVEQLVQKLRQAERRSLTQLQERVLLDACKRNGLPFYVQLASKVASSWRAFTPVPETKLAPTVGELMDNVFERLEKTHGRVFVSRTLLYLAASCPHGLTETELLDILNEDGEVLDEIFKSYHFTSPIRRLPHAAWIRLKADLSFFLEERDLFGRTFHSRHRRFWETAEERYLVDKQTVSKAHSTIADLLSARWQSTEFGHGPQGPLRRTVAATLFHLIEAERSGDIISALSNAKSLDAAVRAGAIDDLLAVVDEAAGKWPVIFKPVKRMGKLLAAEREELVGKPEALAGRIATLQETMMDNGYSYFGL